MLILSLPKHLNIFISLELFSVLGVVVFKDGS